MLGASPDFIAAIAGNSTVISALRVLDENDIPVLELTGKTVDASVTADNSAANLRNYVATIAGDDDSQIPESFASVLGPTSRVQLLVGARIQNIVKAGEFCNTQAAWNNTTTSVAVMNGVVAGSDGFVTLGP
jgi:hypothetical protein